MIDIKDISGNVILSSSILPDCERVEELMKSDHVQLSWNSDCGTVLPVGSYIEYKGERFSLLEPYVPEQEDELEFSYKPKFQSRIMSWGKIPFFMYTYKDNVITGKEPDWNLTDNPANFMKTVCDSIKNETGETWAYTVDASLPASATLPFQSVDVFSALNQIAGAFKTEWWVDKSNKTIHLSKASHGAPVVLEVGNNINTPSVTNGKEGYYTRFYAFGSTRNITQDYKGSNTNNLVNKRLTLDPSKYPNGYKDIRPDLKDGDIFSKVLIFDDIYPSSQLAISDVRPRLMYRLDEKGNKIQLGTDDKGTPVYDQYSIWYFQIPGYTFDKKSVVDGKTPSVHFETGTLAGREFELVYHETTKKETSSDGLVFQVKAGDFEIKFIEEDSLILPMMTGLSPSVGDKIILFNIVMPEEYISSAYVDLEVALDKEIERLYSDLNNYQFNSNPVSFYNSNPCLSIGRNVTYKNGSYSYSTRVIKLVTKLDY
nr:MAG TPA: tail protein [Caudoviricetes sp.]